MGTFKKIKHRTDYSDLCRSGIRRTSHGAHKTDTARCRRAFGLFFLLILVLPGFSQLKINVPVEGSADSTWSIVNYVDWVQGDDFGDPFCGVKSYNGHQGTDFVIRSFKAMDEGVDVIAAASGKVIFVKDGLFDKETVSDVSKGLGNYVAVDHGDQFITYYGHLKKNSIIVSEGQTVASGEKLGEVGSSGNSTDPHLHFELWYDSTIYIDPFAGPCGNDSTYWVNPPEYDTTYSLWSSNVVNEDLTLDSVRFEPKPAGALTDAGAPITYWSISKNVSVGDELSTSWYTPNGDLWFSFPTTNTRFYGYYLYWTYINFPVDGPFGEWKVIFKRNGEDIDEVNFLITDPADARSVNNRLYEIQHYSTYILVDFNEEIKDAVIVDFLGRTHWRPETGAEIRIPLSVLENNMYFLQVTFNDGKKLALRLPVSLE